MKIRKIFGKFLYHFIGIHLPCSSSKINIGQRALRAFCGKLILKKCGKKVNIEKGSIFSSNCELGDYSGFGINSRIYGAIVGKHVMMGPNCFIFSYNHRFERTDITMDQQGATDEKMVVIEDDVWIGANVIILPGVTIGTGSVIGAGTVVTKNVPPYAVFCGNPGVVKKYRNKEFF